MTLKNQDNSSPLESERLIVYIDILGARAIYKGSDQTKINDLNEVIDYFTENIVNTPNFSQIEVSGFSDNLAFSCPASEIFNSFTGILLSITRSCKKALEKGFLIRGAITKGNLYHTNGKIRGTALIKAVELEEKTAVYPRIIVTTDVITSYKSLKSKQDSESLEKFRSDLEKTKSLDSGLKKAFLSGLVASYSSDKDMQEYIDKHTCFERDFDGIYCLNWLKSPWLFIDGILEESLVSFFENAQKILQSNLQNFTLTGNIHHLAKWNMLSHYFKRTIPYWIDFILKINDTSESINKNDLISRLNNIISPVTLEIA